MAATTCAAPLPPACEGAGAGGLACLAAQIDNSWARELRPDPEHAQYTPNRRAREVFGGHFVPVKPTPLREPYLVAYSREVVEMLGLRDATARSSAFASLLSGNVDGVPAFASSWATPYALSIYGSEMAPNGAISEP